MNSCLNLSDGHKKKWAYLSFGYFINILLHRKLKQDELCLIALNLVLPGENYNLPILNIFDMLNMLLEGKFIPCIILHNDFIIFFFEGNRIVRIYKGLFFDILKTSLSCNLFKSSRDKLNKRIMKITKKLSGISLGTHDFMELNSLIHDEQRSRWLGVVEFSSQAPPCCDT